MIGLPWDDGLMYSYDTEEMVKIIWNLSIIGFILLGVQGLLFLFKYYSSKKSKITGRQSLSESKESLISSEIGQEKIEQGFDVFYFATSLLFYGLIVIFALIIATLHGFERMGQTTAKKAMTAIMILAVGIILHFVWKYLHSHDRKNFFRNAKKVTGNELVFGFIGLMVWFTFIGLVMFFMNGVCYCIYNDNLGSFSENTGISTTLSRRIYLQKKICPDNSICRVYATLPETTNTSVFINAHSAINVQELFIVMTNKNTNETVQPVDILMFETKIDEEYGKRKVWTYLFNQLSPDTVYNVTLINEHLERVEMEYRTLPNLVDDTKSIRVIIGGDIGLTPHGRDIFRNIRQTNPDLIIIGGDVAYDNAMTYCYYAWDNVYSLLDQVNKAQNRLVPFILAVGNHDVGYASYATVTRKPSSQKGPWYFAYNPQHFAEGTTNKIPAIPNRKTYGYHIVGQNVIITLDSQYIETYPTQSLYLKQTAQKFRSMNYSLFGLYHVPLYPSCFHPSHFQSPVALNQSHKYYEPFFIEYQFTMCFQNHVHKLKRTKPIDGVVYIGDGNLGVDQQPCAVDDQIFNDKMEKTMYEGSNHYWLGDFYRTYVNISAYAINHTMVDTGIVSIR